jgi:hypothetical protein
MGRTVSQKNGSVNAQVLSLGGEDLGEGGRQSIASE